jgi:hypothetical protein
LINGKEKTFLYFFIFFNCHQGKRAMNHLGKIKISVFIIGMLCLRLSDNASAQHAFDGSPGVVVSIPDAIVKLKRNLTPARKKLSSDLLPLIDSRFLPEGRDLDSYKGEMKKDKHFLPEGEADFVKGKKFGEMAYVYVDMKYGPTLQDDDSLVCKVTDRDEARRSMAAWVEVKKLEKLAASNRIREIHSVVPPVLNTGSVTTQGDGIHRCDQVRSTWGQGGAGIKVGIISDGVTNRASSQATADLPADGAGLTVLSNTVGGNEGTAMLEIAHDMVPDAALYFHDCGINVTAFNSAIDDLVSAGCKVVCDDIGWITEPFFEDGAVATHVKSVLTANDIVYVSSAGNAAASHNQGDYYPIPSGSQHDFSRGGTSGYYYLYVNMPIGSEVRVVLQWNDPFGGSGNDYDLLLYNMTSGSLVAYSNNYQDGTGNPLEWFSYTAESTANYAIAVDQYSGAAKTLEVYIYPSGSADVFTNNITASNSIFGHPAVTGAIAVGAIRASDPGNDDIEPFSSQGPATIAFPSPETRNKPDLCGIDGVAITGAGGFSNPFYGTSAAAPHVAAIAAQLWAQLPSNTGNEIRDMIKATAVDLGASGFDTIFGSGRADALNAFNAYAQSVTVGSPNGGEDWAAGSVHDITWTSVGTSGTVRIEYSTNNGSSWTDVIASTPDDGAYSWTIPDAPSNSCLVRVTDTDGSPADQSDAVFTISRYVCAKIKVWMEGPYQASGMSFTLKTAGSIPLTSPYADGRTVTTVPDGATDWISVELRSSASEPTVKQKSFFLKSDGSIADLDGTTTDLQMPDVAPASYFIVVSHRNHLAVMSAAAVALSASPASLYDFTGGSGQYYGSNGAKQIEAGVWGMWAGDVNQDKNVTTTDYTSWYNSARLGESGYKTTDVNMDGVVTTMDYTQWYNNARLGAASPVP